MSERSFFVHDTSLIVTASTDRKDKRFGWHEPDWETYNRLKHTLEAVGFSFGPDPRIEEHYPSLSKSHHLGSRPTPHGLLYVGTETFPVGCKFEFYQEVVTVNRSGGRYDFDRRQKMPYLVGKAFEHSLIAASRHLRSRGFTENVKVKSPVPDPLAYFNDRWTANRFKRDEHGWPTASEIGAYNGPMIPAGTIKYFREYNGYLMRGRCYGGINGRWTIVYGPGERDWTCRSHYELFDCDPTAVPRRLYPNAKARVSRLLTKAIEEQNFERAIQLRDALKVAA